MHRLFQLVLILILISITSFAQWSADPAKNFRIGDTTMSQDLPKVATSPDGGSYISWFANGNGGYKLYMQRLDAAGKKQWGEGGLLISEHPQNTYLVDYSLITDKNNNAVVAFVDVRTGSMATVAYMISPAGKFVWGADGLLLLSGSGSATNPSIAATTEGKFVIAWNASDEVDKIAMQMISADGKLLWGDKPVVYGSGNNEEGYLTPLLVPSDKGSVIMVHSVSTGKFPGQSIRFFAQKFNAKGSIEWKKGGVPVQSIGYAMKFSSPFVASDGANGAIVSWYDDRNLTNIQSGWVQRINPNGTFAFPADGAEFSSKKGFNKYNSVACRLSATNEIVVFWKMANASQSEEGIYAQKFDSKGKKLWGDDGVEIEKIGIARYSHFDVVGTAKSASLFYISSDFTGFKSTIKGITLPSSGLKNSSGIFNVSSVESERSRIGADLDKSNSAIVVWSDKRTGKDLVYGQKVTEKNSKGK